MSRKIWGIRNSAIAVSLTIAVCINLFSATAFAKEDDGLLHEGYQLQQVVVLSRHNIRAPLSGGDSLLGKVTPYTWHEWSSSPSELSLKGGVLETEMGQFFRKWLVSQGLITENYHPADGEVRVYSNSKQRTIATAQYFTAGMMPTANVRIEYHSEFDTMDPVFNPQLTFCTDEYVKDVTNQINALHSKEIAELQDNYDLVSRVVDMKDSKAWKSGEVTKLVTTDNVYSIKTFDEPRVKGSASTAVSISDALVLQYYEETNDSAAGFGKKLSNKQWKEISEIKDAYGEIMFGTPLLAANVAYPLVNEINSEMKNPSRKFTFLCGHDSNIGSVLADLGVQSYEAPNSVESRTPIGSKIVFSKWSNATGENFWDVDLVYQTTEQLRAVSMLDLTNPPQIYDLKFNSITPNEDGLYREQDINDMFQRAINNYFMIRDYYEASL
ncbi:histidine-type phosphatase [Pseudobutyrivibrio xylanivorans]|uniref:Histidine-type phosphatase n=1 Tax=Pseudobutyrivibrio xylanivorans TaxID=185007 RepID=A0A5P6VQ17_PSEXY|nr:histidine-type phosphatase [Pseudobutyrivibrio xylanivorans]QFJ54560.1 histidine-type phosphatase [Pseudobutyrivibrio xylanivorans]